MPTISVPKRPSKARSCKRSRRLKRSESGVSDTASVCSHTSIGSSDSGLVTVMSQGKSNTNSVPISAITFSPPSQEALSDAVSSAKKIERFRWMVPTVMILFAMTLAVTFCVIPAQEKTLVETNTETSTKLRKLKKNIPGTLMGDDTSDDRKRQLRRKRSFWHLFSSHKSEENILPDDTKKQDGPLEPKEQLNQNDNNEQSDSDSISDNTIEVDSERNGGTLETSEGTVVLTKISESDNQQQLPLSSGQQQQYADQVQYPEVFPTSENHLQGPSLYQQNGATFDQSFMKQYPHQEPFIMHPQVTQTVPPVPQGQIVQQQLGGYGLDQLQPQSTFHVMQHYATPPQQENMLGGGGEGIYQEPHQYQSHEVLGYQSNQMVAKNHQQYETSSVFLNPTSLAVNKVTEVGSIQTEQLQEPMVQGYLTNGMQESGYVDSSDRSDLSSSKLNDNLTQMGSSEKGIHPIVGSGSSQWGAQSFQGSYPQPQQMLADGHADPANKSNSNVGSEDQNIPSRHQVKNPLERMGASNVDGTTAPTNFTSSADKKVDGYIRDSDGIEANESNEMNQKDYNVAVTSPPIGSVPKTNFYGAQWKDVVNEVSKSETAMYNGRNGNNQGNHDQSKQNSYYQQYPSPTGVSQGVVAHQSVEETNTGNHPYQN